jgi:hypothetical protein
MSIWCPFLELTSHNINLPDQARMDNLLKDHT